MKSVLIDALIGAIILGFISFLSSIYGGDKQSSLYRILGFVWTIPITFFFFVNMAARDSGRKAIDDFTRHALIGTILTGIIGAVVLILPTFSSDFLVYLTFFYALILTILYFYYGVYKY